MGIAGTVGGTGVSVGGGEVGVDGASVAVGGRDVLVGDANVGVSVRMGVSDAVRGDTRVKHARPEDLGPLAVPARVDLPDIRGVSIGGTIGS